MNTDTKIKVCVESEVGELEGVILHRPGSEVEKMTPQTAQRALYSDILNLSVAVKEYDQFAGVLEKVTKVFYVKDLLRDIMHDSDTKKLLIDKITDTCHTPRLRGFLLEQEPTQLADMLIEGVPFQELSLTNYLSNYRFKLDPLHNFFFTRDASSTVFNNVFINKMAASVRMRESLIMEAIFNHHPNIISYTKNPSVIEPENEHITIEGGDVLVARNDLLLIGTGMRTTPQGIDFLAKTIESRETPRHIIVQELPSSPESFIHLDMVFTLLDTDTCMVYEPVITRSSHLRTIHLEVYNGKIINLTEEENIPQVLNKLGMPMKILYCGGRNPQTQEREQWHSGANFFAFAPGKIIGYARNTNTIKELNDNGFDVVPAKDVMRGNVNLDDHKKVVVTIEGSELSRGGGGARCMTMPIKRKDI